MNIKELRKVLREEFGPRKYRINQNNDVHVFGKMPNTNIQGRYLYGWINKDGLIER